MALHEAGVTPTIYYDNATHLDTARMFVRTAEPDLIVYGMEGVRSLNNDDTGVIHIFDGEQSARAIAETVFFSVGRPKGALETGRDLTVMTSSFDGDTHMHPTDEDVVDLGPGPSDGTAAMNMLQYVDAANFARAGHDDLFAEHARRTGKLLGMVHVLGGAAVAREFYHGLLAYLRPAPNELT